MQEAYPFPSLRENNGVFRTRERLALLRSSFFSLPSSLLKKGSKAPSRRNDCPFGKLKIPALPPLRPYEVAPSQQNSRTVPLSSGSCLRTRSFPLLMQYSKLIGVFPPPPFFPQIKAFLADLSQTPALLFSSSPVRSPRRRRNSSSARRE